MAYLTQPDYVTYVCSCGQLKPITSLYFCRHCLQIRCGFCICHEVDSHYCANCLENMPSSEARLKKNRCSSCFDCPSCFHTLSTRATLAQQRQSQEAAAAGDAKVENKASKKMYYLSCFNCRWTSRDVGIPDQPVASGGWPERTNPHAARLAALQEYCRAVSQLEKQDRLEKERKKFTIRGKYITLTDKTGLTGAMARSLAGMAAEGSPALASFPPSVAEEEVEGLPEDYYTKEVDLKQITSMPQRLASPEWQPELVSRLQPLPRALSVKRSQRCRQCDHNLTKPEYNPGSIKFKIELLALYHMPEVKIISCDPLKPGSTGSLLLKLCNPTPHEVTLRLLPHDYGAEVGDSDEEEGEEKEPKPKKEVSKRPVLPSYSHLSPLDVSLSLAQRDDAAEYDDDAQAAQPQHEIVMWRKSNKMALRLNVSLSEDAPADRCAVAFTLEYSYRNTLPPSAAAPRQPQDHTLRTTVLLDLAKLTV